jgi:hypothetical protein
MCIVADSVSDVSKTKIASFSVAYSLNGDRNMIPAQLIVYAAKVESLVKENAFILPIYNPGNNYTKIIPLDLSDMTDFFFDLENIYSRWFPLQEKSYAQSNSLEIFDSLNSSTLPVHKVGDYRFSIMPSKYDFNRLDKSRLNVDPAAKIAIDVHNDDYSFIIYQFFQKGKIDISPFGYLCAPCEKNTMILPTIHGHPHNQFPDTSLGYVTNLYVTYKSDFEDKAEYDHEIYALVSNSQPTNNLITMKDVSDLDKFIKQIKKDYMNRNIRIYVPKNFIPKKFKFVGVRYNRNLLIKDTEHKFLFDLTIDR